MSATCKEICTFMERLHEWNLRTRTAFLKYTKATPEKQVLALNFPYTYVMDVVQFAPVELVAKMVAEVWFRFDIACIERLNWRTENDRFDILDLFLRHVDAVGVRQRPKV